MRTDSTRVWADSSAGLDREIVGSGPATRGAAPALRRFAETVDRAMRLAGLPD